MSDAHSISSHIRAVATALAQCAFRTPDAARRAQEIFARHFGAGEAGSYADIGRAMHITRQRAQAIVKQMILCIDVASLPAPPQLAHALAAMPPSSIPRRIGGAAEDGARAFYKTVFGLQTVSEGDSISQLTAEEFECLCHVGRFHGAGLRGAKRVLVDGQRPSDAARACGASPQGVHNSCRRMTRIHQRLLEARLPARARAAKLSRIDPAHFNLLCDIGGFRGAGLAGTRLVLTQGARRIDAARETHVSAHNIYNTCRRMERLYDRIAKAYPADPRKAHAK